MARVSDSAALFGPTYMQVSVYMTGLQHMCHSDRSIRVGETPHLHLHLYPSPTQCDPTNGVSENLHTQHAFVCELSIMTCPNLHLGFPIGFSDLSRSLVVLFTFILTQIVKISTCVSRSHNWQVASSSSLSLSASPLPESLPIPPILSISLHNSTYLFSDTTMC